MPWVCEACGLPHESHSPPCQSCHHDRFEQIRREWIPAGPGGDWDFEWRCPDCDRGHDRKRTRCANCGRLGLEPGYDTGSTDGPVTGSTGTRADPACGIDPDTGPALETVDVRSPRRLLGEATASVVWLATLSAALFALSVGTLFLLFGAPRFGGPIAVGGLIALRSVRGTLRDAVGVSLPRPVVVLVYVLGWIVGLGWYNA